MKIWRFHDPSMGKYARATRRGSWAGSPSYRVQPLIIEWEPDSDEVGDFTWPGFDSDIVVKQSVARVLQEAKVTGFELAPVQMQENSERGKRRSNRRRMQLPYSGPLLCELWVTAWTNLDVVRSTVVERRREDGIQYHEVRGVQQPEQTWDQERAELVTVIHPRLEGQGLIVTKAQGIFRVREFPSWVFCTDDVKLLIEEHTFSNVAFFEMGDSTQ